MMGTKSQQALILRNYFGNECGWQWINTQLSFKDQRSIFLHQVLNLARHRHIGFLASHSVKNIFLSTLENFRNNMEYKLCIVLLLPRDRSKICVLCLVVSLPLYTLAWLDHSEVSQNTLFYILVY